jgi:hypothetical protein
MTAATTTEETAPIRGMVAAADRQAQRRKLTVGKAILVEGPVSLNRITALCRLAGVPIEGPTWPTTVVRVGFLVAVGGAPRRWTLTEKGRAWVEACIAGEAAPVPQ